VKKLLVIANPFPPQASAGTTRVVRFLRHLPAQGWEPTVLAARTSGPAAQPPGLRVIRAATPVPHALQGGGRRSNQLNNWLFVPDNFALWVAPAVRAAHALLAAERFDAIFSSSPRPSVHVVAAALNRLDGVPWLADYRDPWSTYQFRHYPTPAHRAAHRWLEAQALRRAAAVSAVNQPIVNDLLARHPWLEGRTHVLPNGFDRTEAADQVDLGDDFWLVHTGRLYGREQQLEALFAAVATLPADVKLLFVGVDESRVRPQAERAGVWHRVRVEPLVPLARSLGYQRAAGALLLINGRRPESMSSKVFEYLQAGRPIFAISPAGSAARTLFDQVGAAVCVLPDEPMAAPLARFVDDVRGGTAPAADLTALERYELRPLTAELAVILDGLRAGPEAWRSADSPDGTMSR
jgi:glycosyltransferase involved in cell wall biosynthesis